MGKPLVYKPTDYQRHLWKYHKLTDRAAEASEREGRHRYEAFADFSEEVYHRMYSDNPQKLEEPAAGSDVFVKMHALMEDIPEMENFRQKCVGNERWAGIGTAAVIDTLLSTITPPQEQVKDLRSEEEMLEYIKRLAESAQSDEDRRQIEEMLNEHLDANNPSGYPAKQAASQNAASMIDETEVRNAFRSAIKSATGTIEKEEQLLDAFSVGIGKNAGRKARMTAHKKLASIVGNSKELKRIAELAGRLRRIAIEQQRQKPQKGTDEVAGIELGADIRKMVPSEALWSDEDVEMVFASKLHEQSLAQFEMSKTPKKERGPIVMLIDSSGSMSSNAANIWAAAVSLAFLEIAFEQKRAFALLHFSTSTIRKDVFSNWSNIDREKMLEAVSFFEAGGGTAFEQPLMDCIGVIRDGGAFENADIVMITDGCAHISEDFLKKWKTEKTALGFNCYSILVGGDTNATTNRKFSDDVVHLSDVLKNDEAMHRFFQAV